jgi:hypothetical protein
VGTISRWVELFGQRVSRAASKWQRPVPPSGQKTNRINAVTQVEIDTLEQASRTTMVWSPEARNSLFHPGALLSALAGMLAAAAAFFAAF